MPETPEETPPRTRIPPRYPPSATAVPRRPPELTDNAEIVARHSREYRLRGYAVALLFFACAGWFAYDGWVGWPGENRTIAGIEQEQDAARAASDSDRLDRAKEELRKHKRHTETDIMLQRVLAVSIPPACLLFLAWWVYRSRGRYHLQGHTLTVPGHPNIPLEAITRIDKALWDRKGIAIVHYNPAGSSAAATFRLDDIIYESEPTDRILQRLEAYLLATPATPDETSADQ